MTIALGIGLTYAALCGAVKLGHRKLVFPAPNRRTDPTLSDGGEVLRWGKADEAAAASRYAAIWIPAPSPTAPVVVFFHGNGEVLGDLGPLATLIHRERVGVLVPEYPGYGFLSDQSPGEQGMYAAAEAAIESLEHDKNIEPRRIVIVGYSIGSGVAAEMAARGHGSRLVLIAPFTSMVDMVRRFVPIVPTSLLVEDRFETLQKAPRIRVPCLVAHGSADALIPIEMGQRVAGAIDGARFERIEGGHHGDLFLLEESRLLRTIGAFARDDGAVTP